MRNKTVRVLNRHWTVLETALLMYSVQHRIHKRCGLFGEGWQHKAMMVRGSSLANIDALRPNPLVTNTVQMLDESD